MTTATKKRRDVRMWSRWADLQSRTDGIAPGEWVRVRRGTYKDDIGQIWKAQNREKSPEDLEQERQVIAEAQQRGREPPTRPEFVFEGYWVLLVPRLPPPHLTKESSLHLKAQLRSARRRFPPSVFLPTEYDIKLPREHHTPNLGVEIDGHLLIEGLLLKLYKVEALELVPVISPQTYRWFQNHPHSKHFPFPLPELWDLRHGDEVEVLSSDCSTPTRGILNVSNDGALLLDLGDAGIHPISSIQYVSKVVNVGDYVSIARGAHKRSEGLVVERHGSILGISEKGSRKGIDFFVHVNSVIREELPPFHRAAIPWLEKEVTIIKGRHCEHHGIIKGVKHKPNRATLYLWLFLPQQQTTFEVEDTHVFVKGTRQYLWDLFPLTPDQRYYQIQRVGDMSSAKVPWVGTYVKIIGGPHKSKEGTVKDVNRTSVKAAASGLMVTVELNVAGSKWEKVYYDHIREFRTGLTLASYEPLLNQQTFYKPDPKFVGAGVISKRARPAFVSLRALSAPDVASVGTSALNEPTTPTTPSPDVDDIVNFTPDDPNSLPMDVWNPYYDDYMGWSYPRTEIPPQPAPSPVRTPAPAAASKSSTHWLSRAELVGLSIMVEITSGPHKKKEVFVRPTRLPIGSIVPRLQKGKSKTSHDIPFDLIARSAKKIDARDDPLLVVISGQHVGKLVRRIYHFYRESESPENKWYILAVFDRSNPVDCLDGEIIECPAAELEYVEENPAERFCATHVVMKRTRDAARLNLAAVVREPGTGDLSALQTCLDAQIASCSQT